MQWYPQNKEELNSLLDKFLKKSKIQKQKVHGLIVPHAGYDFSGAIAGKAFSLIKDNTLKKAVIVAPSHYATFTGIASLNKIKTPLGEIKIIQNNYPKLEYEHAINNQIPFLQKLNPNIEILPLIIGEINEKQAQEIAEEISNINGIYIFSSDLSHFLPYSQAVEKDKQTIKIIENLDIKNWKKIDACGFYPLLIMMYLCKKRQWKPKLIEYKNSGDIIRDKTQVVGYASFSF